MCLKVDRVLRFFDEFIQKGERWGNIPFCVQAEGASIMYNDNKAHFDKVCNDSKVYGKLSESIERCYQLYEIAENAMQPFYDNQEA